MRRVTIILLFMSQLCYAQNTGTAMRIIGSIPPANSTGWYQLQVGAFREPQNAAIAYDRLSRASLNPGYESYNGFTRVLAKGIPARDVAGAIATIQSLGFTELWIREDTAPQVRGVIPIMLPPSEMQEIGFRTLRVGETSSLVDLLGGGRAVTEWRSSAPGTVGVNQEGAASGLAIGNGFIQINDREYISIVVVPVEPFYTLPQSQVAYLPPEIRTGHISSRDIPEYATEPTFRLAYRFSNMGEFKGASGENSGIDLLARADNYRWVWTTFGQGGWHYDLNGVQRNMENGYQRDSQTGVELRIQPEFIYDQGVPYLQLRHLLHNGGAATVRNQRFGATADVMMHTNDNATLHIMPYGAYMADSDTNPSVELMLVCLAEPGITPVSTLYLGAWDSGAHLGAIYEDRRVDVVGIDTALGFSYQNIDLAPGETKEFIIRFTLARREG